MKNEKIEFKFEWNWVAQMKSLILLIESGNARGRQGAKQDLMDLAKKLDKHNELNAKN